MVITIIIFLIIIFLAVYQKLKLIIEAWFLFNREYPLKGCHYKREEDSTVEIKNIGVEELQIAIFKKYEYIEILKSLINLSNRYYFSVY